MATMHHSTVLITGGTGFLGKRLALALRDSHRIILTGRNNKNNQRAQELTGCDVAPMDVASIESVRDGFTEFRPDIVIHAAATKFVDLSERFPMECIDVNVVGSQNVARVAVERGVDIVLGISTDKASPPVRNTYGLSKAIMERLFCSTDGKCPTRFACVRYGNVAWSTGSVLPIWKRMHEKEGVIGTTGPQMRRFFFSVDEAAQLVLTALENIDRIHGKVLSRKMKAAMIKDILELWIQEKGGRWQVIAGRPGERNDEYLVGDLELPHTEELTFHGTPHYLISFNQYVEEPLAVGPSSANADRLSEGEILSLINQVPEEA
jgi:UDP-N-acetylglucosamine 4,6-dehydratase/5-epimerase